MPFGAVNGSTALVTPLMAERRVVSVAMVFSSPAENVEPFGAANTTSPPPPPAFGNSFWTLLSVLIDWRPLMVNVEPSGFENAPAEPTAMTSRTSRRRSPTIGV